MVEEMNQPVGMGRLYLPDERDAEYRMSAGLPLGGVLPSYKYYYAPRALDQGSTPQCVGYSWAMFLNASPLVQRSPDPEEIYCGAQKRDPWFGDCDNPQYEGSSVRGGAQYLKEMGYIDQYLWAWDAQTVADWILSGKGPVIVGTNWYNLMFYPNALGVIDADPESGGAGGHAYTIIGYNQKTRMFRILNSWGIEWGQSGRAWISFDDLDRLIKDRGEACTATELRR